MGREEGTELSGNFFATAAHYVFVIVVWGEDLVVGLIRLSSLRLILEGWGVGFLEGEFGLERFPVSNLLTKRSSRHLFLFLFLSPIRTTTIPNKPTPV